MSKRERMQKKFDNLDDLNLTSNLLIIQEIAKKMCEKNPDNEVAKTLREAIIKVSIITSKLQLDRSNYHLAIEEYRSRSLRMIERARRAENGEVPQKETITL